MISNIRLSYFHISKYLGPCSLLAHLSTVLLYLVAEHELHTESANPQDLSVFAELALGRLQLRFTLFTCNNRTMLLVI